MLTARIANADAASASELAAHVQRVIDERDVLLVEVSELAALVTRNATGPLTRADPQGLSPAQIPGGSGQVSAGTAFNPAITVIPDGLYYYENARAGTTGFTGNVQGFGAPGADVEAESVPRGFSLREVELAFSGAVDPYFDVWATFGDPGDGAIEAEEVYVQTRRFLPGTQVRLGQFLSGIGDRIDNIAINGISSIRRCRTKCFSVRIGSRRRAGDVAASDSRVHAARLRGAPG